VRPGFGDLRKTCEAAKTDHADCRLTEAVPVLPAGRFHAAQ
jgi:hypothetical protein